MIAPQLAPLAAGRRVYLTGGRKRPMIVERVSGQSAYCTWWFCGKMYGDWFCLSGLLTNG